MPSRSKSKGSGTRAIRVAAPVYRAIQERQEKMRAARGTFVSVSAVLADLLAQTAPKGRGRAG